MNNAYNSQLSLTPELQKRIANPKTLDYYEFSPPMNNILPFIKYQPIFHLMGYLGALVAMGYDALDVSQGELAYRFGVEFEHQRKPTRRTMGQWLKRLASMGVIFIPRSRVYSEGDTKIIYFTDTFKKIIIEKSSVIMCDGVLHAHKKRTTLMNDSSTNPTHNNIETRYHARENILLLDTTDRVEPEFYKNTPVEKRKTESPAKLERKKSDISKVEKQLLWVIRKANPNASHAERQIINHYVLSNPKDKVLSEISAYLQDCDKKPTDSEKIAFAKQHIAYFRQKCSIALGKANQKKGKQYGKQIYSFLHWLIGCQGVKSDKEVLQLQFVVLTNRYDEKLVKLWELWSRFNSKRKSIAVFRAIKYLRSLPEYSFNWNETVGNGCNSDRIDGSAAERRLADMLGSLGC